MVWVRERTIATERPPLVSEVIANFSGYNLSAIDIWKLRSGLWCCGVFLVTCLMMVSFINHEYSSDNFLPSYKASQTRISCFKPTTMGTTTSVVDIWFCYRSRLQYRDLCIAFSWGGGGAKRGTKVRLQIFFVKDNSFGPSKFFQADTNASLWTRTRK
jgi:hypothetical protein